MKYIPDKPSSLLSFIIKMLNIICVLIKQFLDLATINQVFCFSRNHFQIVHDLSSISHDPYVKY